MNPISDLQQQYPLSSRKFLKKILTSVVGIFILDIFLGSFFGFFLILALIGFSIIPDHTDNNIAVVVAVLVYYILFFAIHISLYAWYIKVYIKRYYYAGEEHFITIKKGVFAPAEIHVQWLKIQDVYVDQDIIDSILGLYDVHISSATAQSGIEAHIDGVDQQSADGLKKFLLDKVSGRNNVQSAPTAQPAGGQGQDQGTSAQPVSGPIHSQPIKINLSEEISSKKYPLSDKWFTLAIVSRIASSFGFVAAFIIFFMLKANSDLQNFSGSGFYAFAIWIAVGSVSMVWSVIALFLWRKNYAFNFTEENIYYREGVISLSEKNMPYSSIQDVTVRQGVLERFFGLGKVVIENAAQQQMVVGRAGAQQLGGFGGVMIQGVSIEDANKITNILKSTVLGRNSSQYGL